MKKNIVIILLVVFSLAQVWFIFGSGKDNLTMKIEEIEFNKFWKEGEVPFSNSVVCSLTLANSNYVENKKMFAEVSKQEEPMKLTFINIDAESPKMIGNLGDEIELTKIDKGSVVYLIEESFLGYLNIFTIFRDKNVIIMSKQYPLGNNPFGLLMMGDCLSGI